MQTRGSRFRLVDRYTVHGGVRPLVDRVGELVPRETHYVVLDLDRTVHLGVTLGEVLGWEILSDPDFKRPDDGRPLEPFFAARRPVGSTINFLRGLRDWGLAGLMYAGTVRAGDRWAAWDHLLARRLGSEYVDDVQAVLRNVLMARASSYTAQQLEAFADRAWRRTLDRLVIDREVVARIRAHCPDLKAVILSSASTAPTVAHAAGMLGVDGFISSGAEPYEREGASLYASPAAVPRWFMLRRPEQLSRPGAVFHNSSAGKVRLLHMHYPEVFAEGVVSVGVSDNNLGEDRSWPDYFTHVVALNSKHPFSPFVGARSPCCSISVIDASTVGARPIAEVEAADPRPGEPLRKPPRKLRWHGSLTDRAFGSGELEGSLGSVWLDRLVEIESSLRTARHRLASSPVAARRLERAELGARFASTVEVYNGSHDAERAAAARELRRLGRRLRQQRRQLDRMARECSILHHALAVHLRRAGMEVVARGRSDAALPRA